MNEKRPDLPYEKAAEESAKTIGKGLDLIKQASPAIADFYNFIGGDRLAEQRIRNADKYKRETKRIIEARDMEEKQKRAVPEELAAPLFEAAIRDPREELQKLYAALTVNAIDPEFHDHVRPEFVETVKKWQPIDIRVMQFAAGRASGSQAFTFPEIQAVLATERRNALAVSLEHLKTLGCLISPMGGSHLVSPYGAEIMRAVSEHPDESR